MLLLLQQCTVWHTHIYAPIYMTHSLGHHNATGFLHAIADARMRITRTSRVLAWEFINKVYELLVYRNAPGVPCFTKRATDFLHCCFILGSGLRIFFAPTNSETVWKKYRIYANTHWMHSGSQKDILRRKKEEIRSYKYLISSHEPIWGPHTHLDA